MKKQLILAVSGVGLLGSFHLDADAQELISAAVFPPSEPYRTFASRGNFFSSLAPDASTVAPETIRDADKPGLPAAAHPSLTTLKLAAVVTVVASDSHGFGSEGSVVLISPKEIEQSAGTFGDPSRFLQTMAGVVSGNDQRNDFIVRGGNPNENGFVIDNIEIPSINQLALSDTTGGFVSMLDAEAIQQIEFHKDAYDSKYDQRLSSIVAISTRPSEQVERHSTWEAGVAGAGASFTRPIAGQGSLFVSARESILQYFTNDIGLNGVPHYSNFLVRGDGTMSPRDSWWGLSLTGVDSINIRPSATDDAETNPYETTYKGWRSTTGFNWQHLFSAQAYGVASLAHSDQSQSISQADQLESDSIVYQENSKDSITTVKYDYTVHPSQALTFSFGGRSALDQLHYAVAQPLGLQNPYSSDASPVNVGGFTRSFATFSGATYAQATVNLPHQVQAVVGERWMDWSLLGHQALTGKGIVSFPLLHRLVHVGYSQYAQMPAMLYVLSFDNVTRLKPIRSRQLTAGIVLGENHVVRVNLDAYQKHYNDYPVATDFPQLSLATIADTFGQAFLLFPMTSQGKGLAEGVELTATLRPSRTVRVAVSGAYARSWYSGLDGVLRKSNDDLPVTLNVTGVWELKKGYSFSWRDSYASGRPYTPDNLPLSFTQDRDVYDLTAINSIRSPFYNRLDFRIERSQHLRSGILLWHVGLQNALDRSNFYSEVWQQRSNQGTVEQDQMPLFPDGGIKYSF